MGSTFSEQLMQFALATDYIDEPCFDHIKRLITEYATHTLNIAHVRLLIESESDGNEALIPHGLAESKDYRVSSVKNSDGSYSSHTALAFAKAKPLWIVATGRKKALSEATAFRDLWSQFDPDEIPCYRVPTLADELPDEFKTSIICPLTDSNGILGVLNLETIEYLDITTAATEEIKRIGLALTIILRSLVNHTDSAHRTRDALNAMGDTLKTPIPKLTKPRLFLASSTGARPDVIDAVKAMCTHQRFKNKLQLVYWKDIRDPGNINEQLLRELSTCRYGICYFSEEVDKSGKPVEAPGQTNGTPYFRDNPNVLFEAGMLYGRSDVDAATQVPARWIPIREKEPYSTKPPFDFASERMLLVPRTDDFELDTEAFQLELKIRLKALAKEDALA